MRIPATLRWTMGICLAVLMTVTPYLYYRCSYTWTKRLREVSAGKVYRSGAMTAPGFETAVQLYHIRTIINLQEEAPDPEVPTGFLSSQTIRESELCQRLGVRFVFLGLDILPRQRIPAERPTAIEKFLKVMDDPSNYPVLIHCRAGLHRTGVLTALYRMEYEGWSAAQAFRELKGNGFGETTCTSANDYVTQYVLAYQPRQRFIVSHTPDTGVKR